MALLVYSRHRYWRRILRRYKRKTGDVELWGNLWPKEERVMHANPAFGKAPKLPPAPTEVKAWLPNPISEAARKKVDRQKQRLALGKSSRHVAAAQRIRIGDGEHKEDVPVKTKISMLAPYKHVGFAPSGIAGSAFRSPGSIAPGIAMTLPGSTIGAAFDASGAVHGGFDPSAPDFKFTNAMANSNRLKRAHALIPTSPTKRKLADLKHSVSSWFSGNKDPKPVVTPPPQARVSNPMLRLSGAVAALSARGRPAVVRATPAPRLKFPPRAMPAGRSPTGRAQSSPFSKRKRDLLRRADRVAVGLPVPRPATPTPENPLLLPLSAAPRPSQPLSRFSSGRLVSLLPFLKRKRDALRHYDRTALGQPVPKPATPSPANPLLIPLARSPSRLSRLSRSVATLRVKLGSPKPAVVSPRNPRDSPLFRSSRK